MISCVRFIVEYPAADTWIVMYELVNINKEYSVENRKKCKCMIHCKNVTENEVAHYIMQQVQGGKLLPGTKIEPEVEIAKKFNISRYYIRDILRELVNKGFLYRIQGRGTFVNFEKYTATWEMKKCIIHPARESVPHLNPYSKLHSIFTVYPEYTVRKLFRLGLSDEVYAVVVCRYIADKVYNYTLSYVPVKRFPDIPDRFTGKESFHTILQKIYQVQVLRNLMTMETVSPDDTDREILGIEDTISLFKFVSIYNDKEHTPVEYRITKIRGDMCKFNLNFSDEHE